MVNSKSIAAAVFLALAASAQPLQFNRDIRPILSDRCLGCHGQDAANKGIRLRLDREDSAKADDPEAAPGVISMYDPLETSTLVVGGRSLPLRGDLSAPVAMATASGASSGVSTRAVTPQSSHSCLL